MTLGDYYRANGESEVLRRLEAAVDGEWRPTRELADLAGVSPSFAEKALPYLVEERRVDHRHGGRRWRNEWRLPC